MADSIERLRHTYGQAVQQQVLRERLAARMKTAKPEELSAVLEAIDDWGFHNGVAGALLDAVTDEQELVAIESYLNEWADEQQLAAFAKHIRDCSADVVLPPGKK
jgi:DNA-binding transcriptional regulator YbjK